MSASAVSCIHCKATYLVPRVIPALAEYEARQACRWLAEHECPALSVDGVR